MVKYNEAVDSKFCLMYGTSTLIIGLVVGICLSYSITKKVFISQLITPDPISPDHIRDSLFSRISIDKIKQSLSESHNVFNRWTELGLNVSFADYNLLTPIRVKNKIELMSKYNANDELLDSRISEEAWSVYNPQFSATDGQVLNGTPVFVNYGRPVDYRYLAEELNISVAGHIAVALLEHISVSNVLKLAEDNGAIGLIMFRNFYSGNDGDYYEGEQIRLRIEPPQFIGSHGDPQTPYHPSTGSTYGESVSEAKIPTIPAIVMSYEDAMFVLNGTAGPVFPSERHHKKLDSNIGPGYNDGSYLTVQLNSYLERRVVQNIIGVIEGCVEPDRYLIVGNASPVRGTTGLLMLSEVLTETMKNENWCPQRSLVFCNWAQQEDLTVGMTEWVEQNEDLLRGQAIAYLNVDMEIRGKYTFMAESLPILYPTIWMVTKNVISPEKDENGQTKEIYNDYAERTRSEVKYGYPDVGHNNVKSPFLQLAGVPTIDYYFNCWKTRAMKVCPQMENYDNLTDDNLNYMKALLEVWAESVRALADTPLLPLTNWLDYDLYPRLLNKEFSVLSGEENPEVSQFYKDNNIEISQLEGKIDKFSEALDKFSEINIDHINEQEELMVRRVNDIVMLLERTFIDSRGMPYDSQYKHVLLSPSVDNRDRGTVLAGLHYLADKGRLETDQTKKNEFIEQFKEHMSVVIYRINSAIILLKQFQYGSIK